MKKKQKKFYSLVKKFSNDLKNIYDDKTLTLSEKGSILKIKKIHMLMDSYKMIFLDFMILEEI